MLVMKKTCKTNINYLRQTAQVKHTHYREFVLETNQLPEMKLKTAQVKHACYERLNRDKEPWFNIPVTKYSTQTQNTVV